MDLRFVFKLLNYLFHYLLSFEEEIQQKKNEIYQLIKKKSVNDCSGHGSCNAGTCICNNGYGGDDCSVLDTSLTSGVIVTGNLKTYQWHYYHISVPDSGDTLIISVNQTSRLGDVDVYVKLGSYPTGDNYDLSDTSDSNSISLSVNPAQSGTYYVGLYGFWDVSYNISATINGSFFFNLLILNYIFVFLFYLLIFLEEIKFIYLL